MSSNGRKPATPSRPADHLPAGHVVPTHLTKRQEQYCKRAIGITRFVYNLCVATHQFCRINRLQWPSWQDLSKAVNETKKEDFPFLKEVSYRVIDGAVINFGNAVSNWLNPNLKARKPRFHKKRLTGSGSFRAAGAVREITYNGKRRIKLPYLGSVKLNHTLPQGIIHEAHISLKNGQWLLSVNYDKPPEQPPDPDPRIKDGAADTGINPHATDSERQNWKNPKAYYKAQKKLRRWQCAQARRQVGSRGWWEAQHHIDRLHRKINGLRKHAIHQMTSDLVHKYQNLVIEDLYVKGLMQGKTPKAQADASMGEIKRQLIYKGEWYHCQIYLAPRFYPSSKTCSNCGFVNAKLKRERFWQCPSCGVNHERNENSAINLKGLLALLPSVGGTLRDGKALAANGVGGETGPDDRRTAPLPKGAPQTVSGQKVRPSARLRQLLQPDDR